METQETITFQGKEYVDCTPVEPGCECLACDENREDHLVWNADDMVECASCGARYDPATDCK